MSTLPRFVSRQLARHMSVERLMQWDFPCFLPFYHVVSDKKLPHILNYPYRSRKEFETELDFFLHYFRPVTLEEVVTEKYAGEKVFHLSFDDGLRECAEIIAPVLLKKGIPATFFINTAFAGNEDLFYRYKASLILSKMGKKPDKVADKILKAHKLAGNSLLSVSHTDEHLLRDASMLLKIDFGKYLKKKQPYMTWDQIKQLDASGFTIGAHSHDHPQFWKIPPDEQVNQVIISMDKVVEMVQPKIKAFSFPFTDSGVHTSVLKKIRSQGICDVTFGTAGIKHDKYDFHFQRYPVEQQGDFILNLKTEIVYYKLRKWAGRATVKH